MKQQSKVFSIQKISKKITQKELQKMIKEGNFKRISPRKKDPSVVWLRKQRDGVIGYVEEEIKKLREEIKKKLIEKTNHTTNAIQELVKLNDEIYDIEIESDEED